MQKSKLRISEVVPFKKQKQNPIIAHYQNGELSDEFAQNLDACIASDTKSDKKAGVLVTVSNENAYDGYVSRDFPIDLKRKFIAVRKKDSSEIKLVEVSECNLLSYYYNAIAQRDVDKNNSVATMSSEGAKRIMFKDFGGKKALQVLDRKEKMKVNVDVVKDALDKTILEFTNSLLNAREDAFDKAKIQQERHLEEIVPKMDKEAKKLVDVYKLTDLIESETLECLDEEAVSVLKTGAEDQKIKRKFLVSIIEGIQRSKIPDDPDNMLKIKACIYIDALIAYFKQVNRVRQNQTVKLDPLSEITTKLNPLIRKKFSQPNTFRTTKTNYVVHKATYYIIVLSLLVSDRYEMDIQHIVEEIGIPKTTLFKMMNSIAVRPKAKSNIISIRLPEQLRSLTSTFRKRRTL